METLRTLTERISIDKLDLPIPSEEELEMVFQSALRAPDHGRLTPWQFITVTADEREVLGDLYYEALKKTELEISEGELQKWKEKPLRAPMIIIAVAKIRKHPTITSSDMVLSTAAAVQNMQLALFDMGYNSYWRSGVVIDNNVLKGSLNLNESDQIVGFIYIGTAQDSYKTIPERNSSEYFTSLSKVIEVKD